MDSPRTEQEAQGGPPRGGGEKYDGLLVIDARRGSTESTSRASRSEKKRKGSMLARDRGDGGKTVTLRIIIVSASMSAESTRLFVPDVRKENALYLS